MTESLLNAFTNVIEFKKKMDLPDLRTSGMALAVKRVATALELRGVFP